MADVRLLSLNPHRSAPNHPPTSQKIRKDGRHDENKPKPTKQKKHKHLDRLTGCACHFIIHTDLRIRDSGIRCWFCLFLAGDPSLGFQFLYLSNRRLMTSRILQLKNHFEPQFPHARVQCLLLGCYENCLMSRSSRHSRVKVTSGPALPSLPSAAKVMLRTELVHSNL